MKVILLLTALAVTVLAVTARHVTQPALIDPPTASLKEQYRFRREAKPGSQNSPIWKGKDSEISADSGSRDLSQGIDYRFKREANPQDLGYLSANVAQSMRDKSPSVDVKYQYDIADGKYGKLSVGAGAQKQPGRDWNYQGQLNYNLPIPG